MNSKLKKVVLTALFAALAFCATYFLNFFPTPTGGYVNLGDCFVLTAGFLLGPIYGGLAAGIGSMLADAIAGYAVYILPTFIIKFCMAVVAWAIFRFLGKKYVLPVRIGAAIVGEIVMILGYYIVEATFLGYGFVGAAASIIPNVFQGVFGVVSSVLVTELLTRNKYIKKHLEEL
ncbi:MAG: ECF transporter S component [Eubacteriales bacterium]